MKRTILIVVGLLLLAVALVFLVPSWHRALLGVTLRQHMQSGRADSIQVLSVILVGNEIREKGEMVNLVPSETVNPEVYDLRMELQEGVESSGSESSLLYELSAASSEQIGKTGCSDITGSVFRVRVPDTGLIASVTNTSKKNSKILDNVRVAQILASWWPGLPDKSVNVGSQWSANWEMPLEVPVIGQGAEKAAKATIKLQHRLNYTLDSIQEHQGMEVAKVLVGGEVVPLENGALPAGVSVYGTGRVEGSVLINLHTGYSIIADDRTAWSVVVRMEDENLEYVQYVDRKSRIFRPRLVPDGATGFEAKFPQGADGSLPTVNGLQK